jgi:hypothetical protein
MTARQPSKPALPRDITDFPRHYLRFGMLDLRAPAGADRSEPLPYQWSCHVETESGQVEEFGFLDTRGLDPRTELVEALLAVIERKGAVLVHSARETALLHGLQRRLAGPPGALTHILARLVEVDRLVNRQEDRAARRAVSGSRPTAWDLWPDDAVDPSLKLRDDRAAEAAYLRLIDPRTQNVHRRELARALIEYGDLRVSDLVQAFAEHTGAAPSPFSSGPMLMLN